jgi:hypothetical protein
MTISATTQGIKPGVCLSTNRPVNPFDGQVIYMTDVDQTAVWDGSQWTVLAPIAGGRNVVINGAMQVAQRGTSTASITSGGYYTADRFNTQLITMGTWTQSLEADAPTGSGFRNSLKMLCTTADASPAAADQVRVEHLIEGQNLQQFLKGTASAKPFALSFWVKSNVTGTYIVNLLDVPNSRSVSAAYTISASATWEKKTITLPADTTGAFANDNAQNLQVRFFLGAGSDRTSGTLNTTWQTIVNANIAVGQTNLAAATSNYWQTTGVQLEAGAVATPFEFEDFGDTLAKCQRYYYRRSQLSAYNIIEGMGMGVNWSNSFWCSFQNPVEMRSAPVYALVSGTTGVDNYGTAAGATYSSQQTTTKGGRVTFSTSGLPDFKPFFLIGNINATVEFSSEL